MEGPVNDSESDAVFELVQRCVDAFESGGMPAVDALLVHHPDSATKARRRIETLLEAGLIDAPEGGAAAIPERLGEFRLIEKLGGGGMGVVYLAEQEGLARRVALKLIRPEHLYFPGAKQRFRREVEAVARLSHPGIVQVFTVGEVKGLPYFAMEHVVGASLAELVALLSTRNRVHLRGRDLLEATAAIAEVAPDLRGNDAMQIANSSWTDACTFVLRKVAEALQHAHDRGVLHRDLKPSNVMLTPDGRVLLLDFGLAATEGSTQITQTGTQFGSIAYMAPEQLLGKRTLDTRTDVYGLGVTYYELLTLRVPFLADTAEVTMRLILDGNPPAIRAYNALVPRDVETVCLKAISREPGARYASAAEFMADLTNILEKRPIVARRPGLFVRTLRFTQRHPATAAAVVLGFSTFFVAPGVIAWREHSARERLDRVLAAERTARERAEANYARARHIVGVVQERLGDRRLDDVPEIDAVVRTTLEDVLPMFEEFLRERGDDETLRADAAEAAERVAEIDLRLDRFDAAKQAIDRGLLLAEETLRKAPSDLAARRRLAGMLVIASNVADARGNSDEVERLLTHSIEVASVTSGDPALDLVTVKARASLAAVWSNRGEYDRAKSKAEEARDGFQRLRLANANDLESVAGLASIEQTLGFIESYRKAHDDAERHFDVALEVFAQLRAQNRFTTDDSVAQTMVRQGLAGVYSQTQRAEKALATQRDAVAEFKALADRFPERRDLKRHLAVASITIGKYELDHADWANSISDSTRARDELAALLAADPKVPDDWGNLATAEMNVAAGHLGTRNLAPHREALQRAIVAAEKAVELEPTQIDWRDRLRDIVARLGLANIALYDVENGAECAERLADFDRKDPSLLRRSASLLGRCAQFALKQPKVDAKTRSENSQAYVHRTLDRLEEAVKNGFHDAAELGKADELALARKDPRFAALLESLKPPADVR